jgi:hypothetical protein
MTRHLTHWRMRDMPTDLKPGRGKIRQNLLTVAHRIRSRAGALEAES